MSLDLQFSNPEKETKLVFKLQIQDIQFFTLSCEHGEYSQRTMKTSSYTLRYAGDVNGFPVQFLDSTREKTGAKKDKVTLPESQANLFLSQSTDCAFVTPKLKFKNPEHREIACKGS